MAWSSENLELNVREQLSCPGARLGPALMAGEVSWVGLPGLAESDTGSPHAFPCERVPVIMCALCHVFSLSSRVALDIQAFQAFARPRASLSSCCEASIGPQAAPKSRMGHCRAAGHGGRLSSAGAQPRASRCLLPVQSTGWRIQRAGLWAPNSLGRASGAAQGLWTVLLATIAFSLGAPSCCPVLTEPQASA